MCIRWCRYMYTLIFKIHLFLNCLVQVVTSVSLIIEISKSEIRCRGTRIWFSSVQDLSYDCWSITTATLTFQGDHTNLFKNNDFWWVNQISLLDWTTDFIKHKFLPIAWPTRTGKTAGGWQWCHAICVCRMNKARTLEKLSLFSCRSDFYQGLTSKTALFWNQHSHIQYT